MNSKFKVGDIFTNGVSHFLVEGFDNERFSADVYLLRRLESGDELVSFVSVTDHDEHNRLSA